MSVHVGDTIRFIARSAKRVAVAVVGGALVAVGLAMLVLPGPGFLVLALGFAVLATEFVWAHTVLETGKRGAKRVKDKATRAGRRITRR
jgi:uncharacterized protein (TIGR02611 family)